jgi:hypothetical protein
MPHVESLLSMMGERGEWAPVWMTIYKANALTLIEIARSVDEGVPVSTTWDHTGRLFDLFNATPGTVYLVRPDGHVFARWRECGADEVEAAIFSALQAHNREVLHHD